MNMTGKTWKRGRPQPGQINLEALIEGGGEITIGPVPPFECVATATTSTTVWQCWCASHRVQTIGSATLECAGTNTEIHGKWHIEIASRCRSGDAPTARP